MIDEKSFVDLCKSNGLATFKVTTELDDDTDILLDTEKLEVFFDLCKCLDAKCIFYSYTSQNKDSYELDKEKLIEHIKEFIDNDELKYRYDPFGFHEDAIELTVLLEKYDSNWLVIIANDGMDFANNSHLSSERNYPAYPHRPAG